METEGTQNQRQFANPSSFAYQDENGVDLSLIRELLKLSPVERLRRMDRAITEALRVREYARERA